MSTTAPVDRVRRAVQAGDEAEVHAATDELRALVRGAFQGQEITPGSLLIERRRRVEHALSQLDDAVAGDRQQQASQHLAHISDVVPSLVEDARQLPQAEARRDQRLPAAVQNVFILARKETVVGLRGMRGLLLFGLLLLTFGIGLQSALAGAPASGAQASVSLVWNYAHSLDFLAIPLAGILVGYGLVNEELASDTIHVLASQPISRAGIVAGKWLGMAGILGLAVTSSAGLVGTAAYAATGTLGSPQAVFTYPVACFLLALAFGSIALLASTLLDRTAPTLAAGLGAFVLLGPVWQNVFLTRSLEQAGASTDAGSVLVYLATPFTAWWNWTSELLGPMNEATGLFLGEPWHASLVKAVETGSREALPFYATHGWYAFVMVAWILACTGIAMLVLRRRDLG